MSWTRHGRHFNASKTSIITLNRLQITHLRRNFLTVTSSLCWKRDSIYPRCADTMVQTNCTYIWRRAANFETYFSNNLDYLKQNYAHISIIYSVCCLVYQSASIWVTRLKCWYIRAICESECDNRYIGNALLCESVHPQCFIIYKVYCNCDIIRRNTIYI